MISMISSVSIKNTNPDTLVNLAASASIAASFGNSGMSVDMTGMDGNPSDIMAVGYAAKEACDSNGIEFIAVVSDEKMIDMLYSVGASKFIVHAHGSKCDELSEYLIHMKMPFVIEDVEEVCNG